MALSYPRSRGLASLAVFLLLPAGPAWAERPEPPAFTPYVVTQGNRVDESLTGRRGDAARGLRLYLQGGRTGCLGCHGVPDAPGLRKGVVAEPAHAPRAGVPPLDRVGTRLSPGQIRLWLVAPDFLTEPGTKPSIYEPGQRTDAEDPLWGGPRLTAAEVEDMVTWLSGLTGME